MSFVYPLGLLGLIGIPILIIIYIIKSKYTEQTIASTYLWTLSEKFLKRKNPLSKLTGIISLILQLLAVTIASLAIAHPIITVPNSANEYCFVLDGSGSMNMESRGQSRFEAGKDRINDIIQSSVDGSNFTLVYVGDNTNVIFEKLADKKQAGMLLEELKPAYNETDFASAIGIAQGYFNENPSTLTYLVTDVVYETTQNIQLINVAQKEENYALSDVVHTHVGDQLTVTGNVISYENDAALTVELYLDGAAAASDTVTVEAKKGEPAGFTFTLTTDYYSSIRVKITQQDALALDNEYIIYSVQSEHSYKTLIVSDRPLFLEAMLASLMNAQIDVIAPADYTGQSGYGLYVFDTVDATKLDTLPKDGTIWLLNLNGSVENSGYTVQGEVSFSASEVLSVTTASSSTAKALTEGLLGNDIHITRYIKCGYYRNFTTIMSYQGNPVMFAGTNANGNREVVFAFDIHDSNLPLLYDFTILMRNLVKYSFPDMVEKTTYESGEEAQINVIANCESIRVESPLGNITYLDTNTATSQLRLTEVGVYNVTMMVAGSPREFSIYSSLVDEERDPTTVEEAISLQGQPRSEGFDGEYDPLIILFIALLLIFLADWMVYCYEKYQLR